MIKYIGEDNINFYDELFKSLDETDDEDEIKICQITGTPLTNNSVSLECNHHFNYDALYKEICIQKFVFKTYDLSSLSKKEQHFVRDSKLNYFIKCPYCRHIQLTILPYYEELGLEKKYGVNSLDKDLPDSSYSHSSMSNYTNYGYGSGSGSGYGSDDYTFFAYNTTFKKGLCCENYPNSETKCLHKYVGLIPSTELSYCTKHYRSGLKCHKLNEKKKLLDAKIKQRDEAIKQKQLLLDEKNIERISKGLKPLKRLHVSKQTIDNTVQEPISIEQYEPEPEITDKIMSPKIKTDIEYSLGCQAVLKTGLKKGNKCGCKNINIDNLCKRHEIKK